MLCGPLSCLLRKSASASRHQEMVTSWHWYMPMFSSMPQKAEQWSSTTFRADAREKACTSAGFVLPLSPGRERRCRMVTSCVLMKTELSRRVMPGAGAVAASMVTKGSRMASGFSRWISPATWNRMVRGPLVSTAARREPGPESARVVT